MEDVVRKMLSRRERKCYPERKTIYASVMPSFNCMTKSGLCVFDGTEIISTCGWSVSLLG